VRFVRGPMPFLLPATSIKALLDHNTPSTRTRAHSHTSFNGNFSGKPGSACYPLDFPDKGIWHEDAGPGSTGLHLFRSTSKSRPNNIRGEKNVRPYIRPSVGRPSVRPQKVSSISMKFGIQVEVDE